MRARIDGPGWEARTYSRLAREGLVHGGEHEEDLVGHCCGWARVWAQVKAMGFKNRKMQLSWPSAHVLIYAQRLQIRTSSYRAGHFGRGFGQLNHREGGSKN